LIHPRIPRSLSRSLLRVHSTIACAIPRTRTHTRSRVHEISQDLSMTIIMMASLHLSIATASPRSIHIHIVALMRAARSARVPPRTPMSTHSLAFTTPHNPSLPPSPSKYLSTSKDLTKKYIEHFLCCVRVSVYNACLSVCACASNGRTTIGFDWLVRECRAARPTIYSRASISRTYACVALSYPLNHTYHVMIITMVFLIFDFLLDFCGVAEIFLECDRTLAHSSRSGLPPGPRHSL